jgi:hypothetical protein
MVFPPPPPLAAVYPLSALDLFPPNAPFVLWTPYDTTQPSKLWVDPAAVAAVAAGNPSQVFTYGAYSTVTGQWATFTLTAAQAASLNVPGPLGQLMYEPYTIPPTPAQLVGGGFQTIPLQPQLLSTPAQVQLIGGLLGLSASVIAAAIASPVTLIDSQTVVLNGETRNVYVLPWPGAPGGINVGEAVQQMNSNGIGAPGSFNLSVTTGTPPWELTPGTVLSYPAGNAAGPIPMQQTIPSGWAIQSAGLGGGFALFQVTAAPPASSGGLTTAQDARLTACLDGVNTLLALFGKPPAS